MAFRFHVSQKPNAENVKTARPNAVALPYKPVQQANGYHLLVLLVLIVLMRQDVKLVPRGIKNVAVTKPHSGPASVTASLKQFAISSATYRKMEPTTLAVWNAYQTIPNVFTVRLHMSVHSKENGKTGVVPLDVLTMYVIKHANQALNNAMENSRLSVMMENGNQPHVIPISSPPVISQSRLSLKLKNYRCAYEIAQQARRMSIGVPQNKTTPHRTQLPTNPHRTQLPTIPNSPLFHTISHRTLFPTILHRTQLPTIPHRTPIPYFPLPTQSATCQSPAY